MTTQTETATAPATTTPAAPALEELSLDGRAAQIAQQIREGQRPSSTKTADAPATPSPPAKNTDAPAVSEEQRALDRKERLAKAAAADRENVDRKTRLAEQDKLAKEHEATKKRAEELEARLGGLLDPGTLDEAAILRLAKQKVSPQKLAEMIREEIANPERAAEQIALEATRRTLDPQVKAMKEQIAALEARLAERDAEHATVRQQAEEQRAAHAFYKFTEENEALAPLALRFLKVKGPDEFYKLAHRHAQGLAPGSGFQSILDRVEEELSEVIKDPFFDAVASTPSNGKASPSRAAAKATTVSNRDASTRSSVADEEEDFASLPLEERAARLIQRIAGSS